jgi:hypothetical protein
MRCASSEGHGGAGAVAGIAEDGKRFMVNASIVAAVLHSWDARGLRGKGLRYH